MSVRKVRASISRLGGLFQRQRRERELSEEMENHLALHIEENLRRGMTPEEARRQALIELGRASSRPRKSIATGAACR